MVKIDSNSKSLTTQIDSKTIQINLINEDSLSKIKLQILYYKEHGITNFLINYDSNKVNLPLSKVLFKINLIPLFKLLKENNLKILFAGFPKCIFESVILRPELKWYFENNIGFLNHSNPSTENSKILTCDFCVFNSKCSGIENSYLEKYGSEEFKPIKPNNFLADLILTKIDTWKNPKLISLGKEILEDYVNDDYFLRKKFIFVKTYPESSQENLNESFIYEIKNRKDDFKKTFDFIKKFFDSELITSIENILIKTNQIQMCFKVLKNNQIKKTLYFKVNDLNDIELEEFSKKLNLTFQKNILSVSIINIENNITYRLYNDFEKIQIPKVKEYVSDIDFESKKFLLTYLNSLTKPLYDVLLDDGCEIEEICGKRVDISLKKNTYNLSSLSRLFGFKLHFFENKELISMSFHLRKNSQTKTEFFYSYKFPQFRCIHENLFESESIKNESSKINK